MEKAEIGTAGMGESPREAPSALFESMSGQQMGEASRPSGPVAEPVDDERSL
jgi:hypothetical protein